jgi:hypothetical protein
MVSTDERRLYTHQNPFDDASGFQPRKAVTPPQISRNTLRKIPDWEILPDKMNPSLYGQRALKKSIYKNMAVPIIN